MEEPMENKILQIIKQITKDYYKAIENNSDDFTLTTYVSLLYNFTHYYLDKKKGLVLSAETVKSATDNSKPEKSKSTTKTEKIVKEENLTENTEDKS
jgi:hypothetical protein